MRLRKALFLLLFVLFSLDSAFGMTIEEAKLAIQENFQAGEPGNAIIIANFFKDTDPEFKRLNIFINKLRDFRILHI